MVTIVWLKQGKSCGYGILTLFQFLFENILQLYNSMYIGKKALTPKQWAKIN